MTRRLPTLALLCALALATACGDSAIVKVTGGDGGTDGGSAAWGLTITTGSSLTLGAGSTSTPPARSTACRQPPCSRPPPPATTSAPSRSCCPPSSPWTQMTMPGPRWR